jgi:hypothetical protein
MRVSSVVRDTKDCDKDGNHFEGIGDGKSAVEDPQNLLSECAVGEDKDPVAITETEKKAS